MTTPTSPLLPALKVVAWLHYAGKKPALRRVDFNAKPGVIEQASGWNTIPLVRLSEAEEALQQAALRYVSLFGELQRSIEESEALRAEVAALRGVLVEARRVLGKENSKGVFSAIKDTIWRGPAETLFDYLDAAIDSARTLSPQEAKP